MKRIGLNEAIPQGDSLNSFLAMRGLIDFLNDEASDRKGYRILCEARKRGVSVVIVWIGWGSLIWYKQSLDVDSRWRADGPILPVEFARQSSDGRITLVLGRGFKPSNAV